ncbi:MAG: hypothetical protein LBU51_03085 [Bacteroidales bacterium]|jgi:hypothetical protein|nr:hypothetical protein [Bacteroidales bacterium]
MKNPAFSCEDKSFKVNVLVGLSIFQAVVLIILICYIHSLSLQIDMSKRHQTFSYASGKLRKASVQLLVRFNPYSSVQNRGSGTVIQLAGEPFIATNKHMIYNDTGRCYGHDVTASLFRAYSLITIPVNECFVSIDNDLALIPLKHGSYPDRINISEQTPQLGDALFGLSNQEGSAHAQVCNYIEEKNGTSYTNCGGQHGFSGTGYLNHDAELVFVHVGSSTIPHSSDESNSGFDSSLESSQFTNKWADFNNSCSNKMLIPGCMDKLHQLMRERSIVAEVCKAEILKSHIVGGFSKFTGPYCTP